MSHFGKLALLAALPCVTGFGMNAKSSVRAPDVELAYVEVINMDFDLHHSPIPLHVRAPNDGWSPKNPDAVHGPTMVGDMLVFDNELRTQQKEGDDLHGKTRGICVFTGLEDSVTGESSTTICNQNFRWESGPFAGAQLATQPIAALAGALPVIGWVSEHAVTGGVGMFTGAYGTCTDVDITGEDGTDAWKSLWAFKLWMPKFDMSKPDVEIAYVEVINMDFDLHHSPIPLHIRAPNDGWSPKNPDAVHGPTMVGDRLVFDNQLRTQQNEGDDLHGKTRGVCVFASLEDAKTGESSTTICNQNFRYETGPWAGSQVATQPIAALAGALPVVGWVSEHSILGGVGAFNGAFGTCTDVDITGEDGTDAWKSLWSLKMWLPKNLGDPDFTLAYVEVINMDFDLHHSPIPLHVRAPNDGWSPKNPDAVHGPTMVGDMLVFDNQLRTQQNEGDDLHGKTRGICTFTGLEDSVTGESSTTICNQNFRWESGPFGGDQLATQPIAALAGALPVIGWVSEHSVTGGVGKFASAFGTCTDVDITGEDGTDAWKSLWAFKIWLR